MLSFLGEESLPASSAVKGYHLFTDILVNVGLNSKGASSSQQEAARKNVEKKSCHGIELGQWKSCMRGFSVLCILI